MPMMTPIREERVLVTDNDYSEAGVAMTKPSYGEAPVPRRSGPKGMLPSTWVNRELKKSSHSRPTNYR